MDLSRAEREATPRTSAERRVLPAAAHLAAVHGLADPPEAAYRRALPEARRVTLERLVRGLLRGDPAGLPASRIRPADDPVPGDLPDGTPEPDPKDLRARVPDAAASVGLLPLPHARRLLVAPVRRERGFARHDLGHPVLLAGGAGPEPVDHPVEVVEAVAEAGAFVDGDQAERIRGEVAESVANLAQALVAERIQARRWPKRPLEADASSLPGADGPSALERIVTRGHPYHPAAKIRRGMGPAAGLAYAPEHTDSVPLRFAAVDRDLAKRTSLPDGPALRERLLAAFDGLEGALVQALPPGRSPADVALVPVHPWQYHQVLPDRYRSEIREGTVVPVDGYAHPATPLLNLRTLVPYPTEGTGPAPPHCKTAVGVQLTNVDRTLSPHAVHNGPRVTELLRALLGGARRGPLGVLGEPAAAGVHPPGGPHPEGPGFDHARHLGGLVRTSPRAHPLAEEGGRVVPASSLVARTPSGVPLLAEVLEAHGAARGARGRGEAARSWLEAHARAAVPGNLRLMTEGGVALEAHLQNTLLVLDDGTPRGLLVRDLGGIRLHGGRLADHGLAVDAYPDSDLEADGERDLHRKLYYTLFQNHVAEVVATLDDLTPADPDELWGIVAEVALEVFRDLRGDPGVPDGRVDRDEAGLFADPCEHKAITAMRLRGKRHEYVTSRVPNPLAPGLAGV